MVSASETRTDSVDMAEPRISAAGVFALLISAAIALVTAGLLFAIYGETMQLEHFDMDSEDSVPTWFATILIALNAALLLVSGLGARGAARLQWFGLSAIFVILSIDEMLSFHERVGAKLKDTYELTGYLSFSWVIPGAIFVLAVAAVYLPFLLRLPRRTAALMVLAGAIFVSGALGVEIFAAGHDWEHGQDQTFEYLVVLEEGLEIVGQCVFAFALLDHLAKAAARVRFC